MGAGGSGVGAGGSGVGVGGSGVGVGGVGVGVGGTGVGVGVRWGVEVLIGVGAWTAPETAVSLPPPLARTTATVASTASSGTTPTIGPFRDQDKAQKRRQLSARLRLRRRHLSPTLDAAKIVRLGYAPVNGAHPATRSARSRAQRPALSHALTLGPSGPASAAAFRRRGMAGKT